MLSCCRGKHQYAIAAHTSPLQAPVGTVSIGDVYSHCLGRNGGRVTKIAGSTQLKAL